DDVNYVVDDEDLGPAGATGDFRAAVPYGVPLRVTIGGIAWPPAEGFTLSDADTDVALGAADAIPPSAPPIVSAVAGDATASVTWAPATDNVAVAGYRVYRWTSAPVGAAYSNRHELLASLAPTATSFADTGLTNGTPYHYEIRAFDLATNVGARTETATALPLVARPQVEVTPGVPDGEDGWYQTVPTVALNTLAGRTSLYSFEASPSEWTTYTGPVTIPGGLSTLSFLDTDGSSFSATATLDFKVDTSTPEAVFLMSPAMTTPASAGRSFSVSWGATDTVSGLASYEVQRRSSTTASWTTWRSTLATSAVFVGTDGSNNYFRARAFDAAGLASDWTTITCTLVPYDQAKLRYASGWSTARSKYYYGGSTRYTTRKGASATVSFTKGTLYLVAKTGPTMGKVAVYYRGSKVATVNLHSTKTRYRQVFRILSRSSGTKAYTVKLVNVGVTRHKRVEVDGLVLKR
ncbi:MAG: hypothetical protein HGB10_06695, partial [Coriobacteriia bacterium]|nr:hypothetical protein [Coriobacteriia bacterium]